MQLNPLFLCLLGIGALAVGLFGSTLHPVISHPLRLILLPVAGALLLLARYAQELEGDQTPSIAAYRTALFGILAVAAVVALDLVLP